MNARKKVGGKKHAWQVPPDSPAHGRSLDPPAVVVAVVLGAGGGGGGAGGGGAGRPTDSF